MFLILNLCRWDIHESAIDTFASNNTLKILKNTLLVCSGEPAGIGPDLCLLLPEDIRRSITVVGDAEMLAARAKLLNIDVTITDEKPCGDAKSLHVINVSAKHAISPGKPDARNVSYLLEVIDTSVKCAEDYAGLVTAPVDKEIIARTGLEFIGLTGYLRDACAAQSYLSMFVGQTQNDETLRVAFASMHIPLSQVYRELNAPSLKQVIADCALALQRSFGIATPKLALCGLNPHAGEFGVLGTEEKEWIGDCAKDMRRKGINIDGPLAADSLFASINRTGYDAIIALYHDQGLAPFKALTFGRAAQITFGLPFLRCSPDHGTAYSLAGKRAKILSGGMLYACQLLQQLKRAKQET